MRLIIAIAATQGMLNSAFVGYGLGSSQVPPPVVIAAPVAERSPEPGSHKKAEHAVEVAMVHAPAGNGHGGHDSSDPRAPVEIWNAMKAGNDRFAGGETAARHPAERRHDTATAQHPGAMVLACSDSRVAPELLFDQDVGDLFVVRVAGNVADPVDTGSLEYAAAHLGSKVLVVLGHERCGAVTAALSDEALPTPSLNALVAEIRPALSHVEGSGTSPQRVHDGVEANVRATADKLITSSPILREKLQRGELMIVPAIYNLETGVVRTLNPITAAAAPTLATATVATVAAVKAAKTATVH